MGRGGGAGGGFRGSGFHGGGSSRTHYGGGGSRGFGGGRGSGGRAPGGKGPGGKGPGGPRPGPGGPFWGPRPHRTYIFTGPRRAYGPGCTSVGCAPTLLLVIVLILILVVFASVSQGRSEGDVRASTVERTKLAASDCRLIDDWFEDNMSPKWVFNDRELIKGLRAFYEKTGVQPYLILLPNIDGDVYPTQTEIENELKARYDALMPDGGHVIIGFVEGVPSEYAIGVYAGAKAEVVMDAEAREILMDYLDYYYTDDDLDTEAYFVTAFERTAEKIMKIDEIKSQSTAKIVITVGVVVLVIVIAVAIVRYRKHKADQAKADAEILNSDLSDPSKTDPDEDLKDKYGVD